MCPHKDKNHEPPLTIDGRIPRSIADLFAELKPVMHALCELVVTVLKVLTAYLKNRFHV